LDLIRRAVERFGRIESGERPSPARSDHVQNVNRVLNKIVPVHSAFKAETFPLKGAHRAKTGRPLMDGVRLKGYQFSRFELAEIL
jgi:hypothetical protein